MFRPRTLCQMKPAPENQTSITFHKSSLPAGYLTSEPQYKNIHKEFPSKTKKPMQIHNKGYLIKQIDRRSIEDIPSTSQSIDFKKLLLQFKTAEEVGELQVADILDIDGELLEDLKQKCKDFTDAASYLAQDKKEKGQKEEASSDEDFMNYLMEQYAKMQTNKINLDIVVNNIEKIKSLNYSADGVKVFFN